MGERPCSEVLQGPNNTNTHTRCVKGHASQPRRRFVQGVGPEVVCDVISDITAVRCDQSFPRSSNMQVTLHHMRAVVVPAV